VGMLGNPVIVQQSLVLHAVAGTPIQFSTTFNSVVGTPSYELFLTLERLQ